MKYTRSFLNYPGGKYRIINQLLHYFPLHVSRFIDLFEGSGVVSENYDGASYYLANDINKHLVSLQKYIINVGLIKFKQQINYIIQNYNLTNTFVHGYKYYHANSQKGLSKINYDGYIKLRNDYNKHPSNALLYVLIVYGFNNQIRFNNSGKFNNPCGKRDWNLSMRKKLRDFYLIFKSKHISLTNQDFHSISVNSNDFIYADPPYSITTAVYNDDKGWDQYDDKRLFMYLDKCNLIGAKFALSNVLIHKNKINKPLIKWSRYYNVHHINNSYNNASYHTTNGKSDEVLITNY